MKESVLTFEGCISINQKNIALNTTHDVERDCIDFELIYWRNCYPMQQPNHKNISTPRPDAVKNVFSCRFSSVHSKGNPLLRNSFNSFEILKKILENQRKSEKINENQMKTLQWFSLRKSFCTHNTWLRATRSKYFVTTRNF